MARKERMAMDNFDVDMDLDFKFESYDSLYQEPKADERSAITKVGRGVFRGAFNALTGFGTIKKVILKALPREFGEVDRAFSQGVSVARDLYDKSLKELDPAFRDLSKSAKRALPAIGKELPGGIGIKIDAFAAKLPSGDNGSRGPSPDELRELALQNQVAMAMGQGQAQTALAQQQLVQTAIGNKMLGLQHNEAVKYLNAIRISSQNIDNYNTSVTVNYQRKSLEINLRMLSLQAESLNDGRRFAAETMQRLDGIMRNTALPEYAKLRASERFGEAVRNRFIGKSLDNVGNRSREFMEKFGANLKSAMSEKMDRLREAFETGTMAMDALGDQAEMMDSMAGMGDGMSMTDMLSEQAGQGIMEKFMMELGKRSRKSPVGNFLRNNKYAQKFHYFTKEGLRYAGDIPGAADAFRESTAGDSLPFVRALKDLFPNMSPDVALSKLGVGDLQGNAIYTAKTDKTINKVIPELLARQLRELTMLRTGNTNVEMITYDHFKDEFVSKKQMTDTVFSKVINQSTRANIANNKEALENYLFDENSNVSREARDKFFNLLMEDSIHGKNSDARRYTDTDAYLRAGITGDDADKLTAIFRNKFGYDESGKALQTNGFSDKRSKFQELYRNSSGQMDHQQMVLQTLINAGYADELKATGLLDSEGNLNKQQLYDYMSGANFDSSGIENSPDYEGFGFRRTNRRKAGHAVRSWGTKDLNRAATGVADDINASNYMHTGVGSGGGADIDRLVDAIRDANIRSIATQQSETLQRIELIMLEKEFGGNRPGMFDKMAGYGSKVQQWFKGKLGKWSEKFEGTRKFLTSTRDRAKSIWDFGKKWGGAALNFGKRLGTSAYGWTKDKAINAGKYAWDKTKAGAEAAYEFGRDTALPTMTEWGTNAGKWTMDQAGKTGGRLSRAGDWIGDKFGAFRRGMSGDGSSQSESGGIGRAFGKLGSGLGWLAGSGIDAAKSLTQRLLGGGVLGRNTQKTVDILSAIYKLLDARLPNRAGDKDGNGYAEGTWQDQYADEYAENKEKAAAGTGAESKNGGILAGLAGLFSGKGKKDDAKEEDEEDDGDTIVAGGSLDIGGDGDDEKKGKGKGKSKSPKGKPGLWSKTKQFGRNLLKSPLKTGLAGLATLGKAGWWLAKNAATRVAWPLAKAVVMTVGIKPLLIAAAIAGAGYLAYRGYKALTAHRFGDMSSIRYQQYGFAADDQGHFQQVMDLELKIEKFVKTGEGGSLTIDDSGIETAEIVKDFGLNPESRTDVNRFISWYQERFKPVYLTWLTAMKNTGGKKISAADSLSAQDKLALLKLVAFPDGPYGYNTSPFKDLKSLPSSSSTVANAVKVLTATLEKSAQTETTKSQITETQAATAGTAIAATQLSKVADKQNEGGSKNAAVTSMIGQPGSAAAAAASTMVGRATVFSPDSSANVVQMNVRELTPIESIRMRVYGLTSSDSLKVSAILRLEALVLPNTATQGDVVVWKGDVFAIANRVSGLFQFSTLNSDHGEMWQRWFVRRFLPTYLAYLTNIFKVVGSFNKDGDQGKLNPIQMVNLANAMSGATYQGNPVWSFTDSPFRDYTLTTSPESVSAFIDVIANKAKEGATLKEEANRHMSTNDSVKTAEAAKSNISSGSGSQPGMFSRAANWISNTASSMASAVGRAAMATASGVAGAGRYIAQSLGLAGSTADVSDGTGGKIDQLPMPKPGSGYQAFKELLDAAAKMVGVNPTLLAIICAIESSFNPSARPIDKNGKALSSAAGLFQFIKSTWQSMLAKFGKMFGISMFASPTDPRAAALMGAQFLKTNIEHLKKALGRPVTFVEAYMAHFLGAPGASRVLKHSPETILAPLMPDAVKANPWVFLDKSGRAKSLGEILSDFATKFKKQAERWGIKLSDTDLQTPADKEGAIADANNGSGAAANAGGGIGPDGQSAAAPTPAGMGGSPANTPTVTAGSDVSKGGTADGMLPVGAPAPSPVMPSSGDAAATQKARQEEVNQKQTVSSAEVTAILKESLATQMRSELLLREISNTLKNGASAIPNAATPDPRSGAKQVSGRPMPTEAVSLRRSA